MQPLRHDWRLLSQVILTPGITSPKRERLPHHGHHQRLGLSAIVVSILLARFRLNPPPATFIDGQGQMDKETISANLTNFQVDSQIE